MTQSRVRSGGAQGQECLGQGALLPAVTVAVGSGETQLTVPKGKPALSLRSTAGLEEIMESWNDLVCKGP